MRFCSSTRIKRGVESLLCCSTIVKQHTCSSGVLRPHWWPVASNLRMARGSDFVAVSPIDRPSSDDSGAGADALAETFGATQLDAHLHRAGPM